ncbi:MAG: endonuclease/exonuclease/phosphatase family protein [Solirubrobacterales bacterium]
MHPRGPGAFRKRLSAPPSRAAIAIAWLLVAFWAGWALVRALGLDRGWPLVPMIAFTPYVAATAVIPVAVAALLRRWGAVAVATAAALLLVGLVLPRAFSDGEAAAGSGVPLNVMTANLHFGEADPAPVVELVRAHRIDVLSVQELTPGLAVELRRAGLERELPHGTERAAPTAHGSGIYSRYPLTAIGPARRRPGAFFMPTARIAIRGYGRLEVTAVHPPPPTSPGTVRDWRTDLAAMPSAVGSPLRMLLGDFNATLDHDHMRDLIARGYRDAADSAGSGLTPTWSAARIPLLPFRVPLTIDHLLVDERIGVRQVGVHDLPGSDHDAVTGELLLP